MSSVVSLLMRGRAAAESLMVDMVNIRRQTGTTPDGQGGDTPTYSTIYSGPGKVQSQAVQALTPEAGGHTATVQRLELHIPVGSCSPAVGDVATVTACLMDPNLVGHVLRITALPNKSLATAYRIPVEDTTA